MDDKNDVPITSSTDNYSAIESNLFNWASVTMKWPKLNMVSVEDKVPTDLVQCPLFTS